MNGGVPVSHRSAQALSGIHNLGEDLIAICTLTSFPPAQGTPTYMACEACIKELTAYVQRLIDTAHSCSRSVAQVAGATTVHQGGAAAVTAHHDGVELAAIVRVQPRAIARQPVAGAPALAARAPTQPISVGLLSSQHRREERPNAEAPRQEDAPAACRQARVGADPARAALSFGSGCLAFTDALHRVTWPASSAAVSPTSMMDPRIHTSSYRSTLRPCRLQREETPT
jgi:hypothetical protein